MEQKYEIELKILAIISVTHLNDLQTHIFLFIILISVFKKTLDVLASIKIIYRIGFGLDHLATLPAY
jgi:hypothetical protein